MIIFGVEAQLNKETVLTFDDPTLLPGNLKRRNAVLIMHVCCLYIKLSVLLYILQAAETPSI